MKEYFQILTQTPLFCGVEEHEIDAMLACLGAKKKAFEKGQSILHRGDLQVPIGVVLAGRVEVVEEDFWGNRNMLAQLGPGELFGEAYACVGTEPLRVQVVATAPTHILLLDAHRLLTTCDAACDFHARLVQNLVRVLAQKNLMLTRKISHMSRRTTRDKLISYLSAEAQRAGSRCFSIAFSRQQLADYLGVERSAMSAELGKLRKEGVLRCEKNEFELL